MTIEQYEGYSDYEEAWEITGVNLEDVLTWLHVNHMNPSMYTVEYAECGSHSVILERIKEEE